MGGLGSLTTCSTLLRVTSIAPCRTRAAAPNFSLLTAQPSRRRYSPVLVPAATARTTEMAQQMHIPRQEEEEVHIPRQEVVEVAKLQIHRHNGLCLQGTYKNAERSGAARWYSGWCVYTTVVRSTTPYVLVVYLQLTVAAAVLDFFCQLHFSLKLFGSQLFHQYRAKVSHYGSRVRSSGTLRRLCRFKRARSRLVDLQ